MINIQNLYTDLIQGKVKSLIIDYKPERKNGKYDYLFKHHELRNDVAKEIADLLINSILFYAYSLSEIETQKLQLLGLRKAATFALSERLSKRQNLDSDGLVGELMLDILIQEIEPNANKLFTRAKYSRFQDNAEITGYDAAYFLKKQDGKIELWLGQSKAGELYYCKKGLCEDLNSKYLDNYFSDAIRYMKDRGFEESPDCDITQLLFDINNILFQSINKGLSKEDRKKYVTDNIFKLLSEKDVSVRIPCLLMFDSQIYKDETSFKDKMEKLCDNIFSYFEKKKFNSTNRIKVSIVFIVFPINNLKEIKQIIVDVKKDVQ